MDGPQGHYTKWKEVRERQIPYYLTYMWNLKKVIDTDWWMREGGWGVGGGRNQQTGFLVIVYLK